MSDLQKQYFRGPWLWLIRVIGVIVPRRLRADWRQEWEAELRYRETQLAEWDRLDRGAKLALLWHSLGAFADALWLQPRRMEDEMFQDLRYGVRMLLKTPGFTFVAVLTLALGIGANTAIFSLVKAVSLRPLPYHDPDRLAMLWTDDPKRNIHEEGTSYPNFLDWRSQNQLFTDLAICSRGNPVVLTGGDGPERLTGLLFGLAPAWKVSRSNPNEALKEGGRGSSGGLRLRQTRGLLVVVECALAVALLASAGLMIRSFMRLQTVDPGFKPESLLLARVSLPQSTNRTGTQTTAFFRQVIEQVAALPGVHAAGVIEDFIMRRNPDNAITVEGRAPHDAGQGAGELIAERVSHDLFQALAMPLLKGRFFTRQETLDSHVVIINETLARRYFPGEDPIGKRFKFGGPQSENNWFEIVGIVGDLRRQRLEKQAVSEVYAPGVSNNMDLLARVSSDPLTLVGPIRREIRSVDPTAAVYGLTTGTHLVEKLGSGRRFQTGLLALFAMVALVLATIGLYGVMRYAVAQRTHEIGIRLALGASSADVLRLVIGQGMRLTLIGVATGLLASFALSRVMTQLLFGVSATDPATFAGVAFALMGAALLACYLPARRATKVDPLTSLRHE